MILSASNICKSYGIDTILNNVSFMIEPGEKTAFVGVNGAGKTTLFKILSGQIKADSGQVILSKTTTMAFLEQDASFESQKTIYDELKSAFDDILAAEQKIREMEQQMASLTGDALEKHLAEYNDLLHFFEINDGYRYESLIRGVISGLGLDGDDISQKQISTLSGGQKTRVALGKQLLKKPDLLLLDEPTNHLDIDSISWLESYLKAYTNAVLIISHDRYFMDAVVSKVVDIEYGTATVYTGGYSDFIERKEINQEIMEKQYKDQQKEIKKQEETIRLLRSFNREKSIKRAESREKLLAKMARIDRPQSAPANMRFSLVPKIQSGNDVLAVHNLAKSYGENHLFSGLSFDIKREESVALIGPNGIGKTTILRIIMQDIAPDAGKIREGVNVKIGYYDQERQKLDASLTILQQIQEIYPRMNDGEIRNVLAAFLFRGDDVYKPIKALSGGERGRVCLAIIMLGGANFLILDEPTNHLDMYSKEILENALLDFQGTILYVSHDRYFINRTATRVLELSKNGVKSYLGNYDYYIEKKAEEAELAQAAQAHSEKNAYERKRDELAAAPKDWHTQKAEKSAARKKQSLIEKIEAQIMETEAKIQECDELLCFPEVFSDALRAKEIFDLKQDLTTTLESLYEQWEEANAE